MPRTLLAMTRREVLAAAAVAAAVGFCGMPPRVLAAEGAMLRFNVNMPGLVVTEMKCRVESTLSPDAQPVNHNSQGAPLLRYWGGEYDWSTLEAPLNALPMFLTEIGVLDIHFIHPSSRYEYAPQMIMIHGWPGSIIELLKVVGPFTDPTAHDGKAEDAFHVTVPAVRADHRRGPRRLSLLPLIPSL